jgi:hypothetical protein
MSHYGIIATHWNVNLGEIDEVQLHKVVQRGQGKFALAPGELAWCSDVASLIDGGDTVWVIVSDGLGKYKNTDHVRVNTRDGGRRSLYSCTKDGTPTSALTDLPRYIRPDDPLPTSAKELLAKARNIGSDPYPTLTQQVDGVEAVDPFKLRVSDGR